MSTNRYKNHPQSKPGPGDARSFWLGPIPWYHFFPGLTVKSEKKLVQDARDVALSSHLETTSRRRPGGRQLLGLILVVLGGVLFGGLALDGRAYLQSANSSAGGVQAGAPGPSAKLDA